MPALLLIWNAPAAGPAFLFVFRWASAPEALDWTPPTTQHPHLPSLIITIMPWCDPCDRFFPTERGLQQHLDNSSAHAYSYECETCTRTFATERACNQHMNELDHWEPTYECETCTATFSTQYACDRHMDISRHRRHYCYECQRGFQNDNNLRMVCPPSSRREVGRWLRRDVKHLNSRIHQGAAVACPFCERGFTSASGVSHHLETGSCPKATNLNRDTIYNSIRARDTQGVITMKQLEWNSEFVATERSFNGYNYVCFICRREFSTLVDLNKHLKSPVHQQKLYHCPNRRGCGKEFVSLAAMFNHLESESCGFIRFGQVNDRVSGMLTGRQRFIAFWEVSVAAWQ
jgi:hypothetical protein